MSLNVLKDIRKIYASLNTDEIRAAAWQELNVGLMASSEDAYVRMERFLAPPASDAHSRNQASRAVHRVDGSPAHFDFVLCEPGIPVPANGFSFEPLQANTLVDNILKGNEKIELALGRTFPLFRSPATHRIIHRVARENAFFSLVTALPNVVPSVLELPWTVGEFATDTAFITMNQIRMALSIAAAHGRPVGYTEQ
ncbi:MAG: hypothetical protein M3N54_14700, partial [Acidobacteriota bacterium]|nr:hypothetical protein [Acidobacteriota bacterium]